MDKMLRIIAAMNDEEQKRVFKELEKELGSETTKFLRERVFYIKLFTDNSFYKTVVETLGNKLYEELS